MQATKRDSSRKILKWGPGHFTTVHNQMYLRWPCGNRPCVGSLAHNHDALWVVLPAMCAFNDKAKSQFVDSARTSSLVVVETLRERMSENILVIHSNSHSRHPTTTPELGVILKGLGASSKSIFCLNAQASRALLTGRDGAN